MPTKTTNLTKGQGGYFNLQIENTTVQPILTAFEPMIWIANL
jgi:hypothetical protein